MKKIIAILLTLLMVISLAACSTGTIITSETTADATEAPKVDITKYEKSFNGMQKYLVDLELINSKTKVELQADVIGAKKGVRYTVNGSFVEFYVFDTEATPDEAQKVYDGIADGSTYKVLGIEDVKGAVSSSGKYVLLYPATSTFDYSEIIEEFSKF